MGPIIAWGRRLTVSRKTYTMKTTDQSVSMPQKKDIEEARRRQILDAAEKVFIKRGIDKARMDDIVQESGLSKGALYWYFKSKDAIVSALVAHVLISEMREAEALVQAGGSASERLKLFIAHAVREYKRFENVLPLAYEFVAHAAAQQGRPRDGGALLQPL